MAPVETIAIDRGLNYGGEQQADIAVSWGAIFAGAAAAAALSLILLMLGAGLGLSSVSPWRNDGASASAIGISTVVWLAFTQLAASGMGGYLAGRLRSKWTGIHAHEAYFRDTAHGFLAWAVATLVTAALLTSAIGGILGAGAKAGVAMTGISGGAAAMAAGGGSVPGGASAMVGAGTSGSPGTGYFVDSLFRKDADAAPNSAPAAPSTDSSNAAGSTAAGSGNPPSGKTPPTAEVTRIFMNSIGSNAGSGALPPDDQRYVAQLVAQRTGLSRQDAEKRVADTYTKLQAKMRDAETAARDAADKARKASAYATLWMFITLLIGAFVASLAATFGGRRRDLPIHTL
ncbi:hypothetical protein RCH10_004668 [Variovorax sp. GrIS 2.14]